MLETKGNSVVKLFSLSFCGFYNCSGIECKLYFATSLKLNVLVGYLKY